MSPGTVKMQLDSMNQNLDIVLRNAKNVLNNVSAFGETKDSLRSDSYDNIRTYYEKVHISLLHGCILYAETLLCENRAYKEYICQYLTGIGYVDEDALRRDKISIERQINSVYAMMKVSNTSLSSYMSCLQNALKLVEKKLEQIEDFRSVTNGLYQNLSAYRAKTKSGIACMNNIKFSKNTCKYVLESVSLNWTIELNSDWADREKELEIIEIEVEGEDIDSIWNQLYDKGSRIIDLYNNDGMETAIKFIREGVTFNLITKNGKHYVQMLTRKNTSGTIEIWDSLTKFMKENVKDVDWDKVSIKQFMRGSEAIHSNKSRYFFESDLVYGELEDALKHISIDSGLKSTLSTIGKNAGGEFLDSLKFWDDFNPKHYMKGSSLSKLGKVTKGLGAITTVFDVGVNAKEAFWEDGEFELSGENVQEFAVDTGVDLVADAGAAAAGAAVGSFFLPPVGTVVGAVAGAAVGMVLDTNFFDSDNDGKGDFSIKDKAKSIVSDGLDAIKGLFS